MHVSSRFVTILASAIFTARGVLGRYALDVSYDSTNFFDSFDHFTDPDPTRGFVEYVDGQTANAQGLSGFAKGGIFMGVDYTTVNPSKGRRSVRLTSKQSFTHGLFIADIAHMPGSICGTWPAFWMFGPSWPAAGEIDIIEGVNTQTQGAVTLHTNPGCVMSNAGTVTSTRFKTGDCAAGNSNEGCPQETADNQNYGDGFNAIGGGVYATEWTSDHIAVWFFPRHNIPQDIISGSPDPTTWSSPTARFLGGQGCDIDSHFRDNNLVFDTTFCGDWAGDANVWAANPECSALAPTCVDYVSGNPQAFAEAFWLVNSVKVYQQPGTSSQQAVPTPFTA